MPEHEAFFSFSVPDESATTDQTSYNGNLKTNNVYESSNKLQLSLRVYNDNKPAAGLLSGSASPTSSNNHRPTTATPFAFNVPPPAPVYQVNQYVESKENRGQGPVSSLSDTNGLGFEHSSRQQLSIRTTGVSTNSIQEADAYGRSPIQPSASASAREPSLFRNHLRAEVGLHNTRPMTAPGADWSGGNHNHSYDYSSVAFGLFGGSGRGHPAKTVIPDRPDCSDRMTSAGSLGDTDTQKTAANPHYTRYLPETPEDRSLAGGLAPSTSVQAFTRKRPLHSEHQHCQSIAGSQAHHSPLGRRPSTHAGTSSGFGDCADSSYGAETPISGSPASPYLSDYRLTSQPGTSSLSFHNGRINSSCEPVQASTDFEVCDVNRNPDVVSQATTNSYLHLDNSNTYNPLYSHPVSANAVDTHGKPYLFNSLPGGLRKRPRRRYDEIERLYNCTYTGCSKAYGTLNHLNAHIVMQKHGPKRLPQEFKEMRKEWRARKRAEAEARSSEYPSPTGFYPPPTHYHQTPGSFGLHNHDHQNYRALAAGTPSQHFGHQAESCNPAPIGYSRSDISPHNHYAHLSNNRVHPATEGRDLSGRGYPQLKTLSEPFHEAPATSSPQLSLILNGTQHSANPNSSGKTLSSGANAGPNFLIR